VVAITYPVNYYKSLIRHNIKMQSSLSEDVYPYSITHFFRNLSMILLFINLIGINLDSFILVSILFINSLIVFLLLIACCVCISSSFIASVSLFILYQSNPNKIRILVF